MNIVIIILIVILVSTNGYAQNQHGIDSLNTELQKYEMRKKSLGSTASKMIDTTKANILDRLCWMYREVNWDKQLSYASQCLAISERIGYKKGVGNAYNNIGMFYYSNDRLDTAKQFFLKALKVRLEINDGEGIGGVYNNLGLVFGDQGNMSESLRNYLIALKYAEKGGSRFNEAAILNNIGLIYDEMGNSQASIDNYNKAITINRKMGNKNFLVNNLSNKGGIEFKLNKYSASLKSYFESLSLAKELHQKPLVLQRTYREIATNYVALEDYPTALKYYDTMLAIAEKENSKGWIASTSINIGTVYEKQGRLQEALHFLQKGLKIKLGRDEITKNRLVYQELSVIYKKMKNYKAAWEYYDKYEALKDTTDNVEVAKTNVAKLTQMLSQSAFDKQQDSTNAEQSKRDAVTAKEIEQQKWVRNALIGGFAIVVLFAGVFFKQRNKINIEKKQSDSLLLNILPAEVAEELKAKGTADAKHFDNVTVLFTDFKSFTTVSEQLTPQELVNELHTCFKAFDEICTTYSIEKIKTIGDAYLAVCGLPLSDENHAEKVLNAALEIREFMANRGKELGAKTFEIRIGINSGSVVAGIVGVKKFAYDIWGDTVNTAARMEQNSEAGKINISESTYALVKDEFTCEYRGEIDAKNKGKLKMYFVENSV